MGGHTKQMKIFEKNSATMLFRQKPCCCLCCLKPVPVTKCRVITVYTLVLQCSIFRPLLMFIAAVAWADGVYNPTDMSPSAPALWISILSAISAVMGIYGLFVAKDMINP